MIRNFAITLFATIVLGIPHGAQHARACTGITIKSKDGAIVFGRTLEFGTDLKSNVILVPVGTSYTGSAPGGRPGLQWKGRYAAAGMNAYGLPVLVDGVNDQGLYVGLFYFPGYAGYQEIADADVGQALAPHELGTYLLTMCADVEHVLTALRGVKVGAVVLEQFGFVPPCHYIVCDKSGQAKVLEYVNGRLNVHDNPLGVMANSPTFDWHMTNLANYINLSPMNIAEARLADVEIRGFGQGTGMLGLPGDFTPPSRFVRAAGFSKSLLPVATAQDAMLQTFHVLNQFDIPKGAARSMEAGQVVADYTLWTSAVDLTHQRYYFRTYGNSRIRSVDLKTADLATPKVKTILIDSPQEIEDVTTQAR